jgi:ribosomal protein S18 acetylase RimI-like enzyme
MALKPVRRIGTNAGESLYDEIAQQVLAVPWSRAELDQVEREHPDLIVRRDGNVLAALANGSLAYAFQSQSAFIDLFPAMFEQLLPRIRRELDVDSVRFRLLHNPARPIVEPVLKNLWFTARPAWFGFSLAKKTPLPKIAAIKGVKFRDGGLDDVAEMIRIDRECFPDTPMPTEAMRRSIEQGERALIAIADGRVAGYALYRRVDEREGYLWVLVVSAGYRGRGIGEALTVRVAKKLFAEGVDHVDLKTDDDNAAAIRLYVRLGFKQTIAGRDYARPTDPRAITRLKKTSEGTLIRFGGWR